MLCSSEACSETCQTPVMVRFEEIASFNSSTFFSKRAVLDVWQDFILKFIKPLEPGVH